MIRMKVAESHGGEKARERVGLLLRITPKEDLSAPPTRIYRRLFSAVDVLNLHLDILNENPGDGVWFSHSQVRLNEEIDRLIVFNWKAGRYFAVELFFDRYAQEMDPFIPTTVSNGTGRTPEPWRNIPEKCWVHVTGYKDLLLSDIASIRMLRSGDTMDIQIKKNGFRSAEFEP